MHIPIVSIKHFRDNYPDVHIMFMNHKKEIFKKKRNLIKENGFTC